ncbi:response regulator [Paraburkholderia franconis]|uniref:response regulator n=1 Tax=Paraburkholderia franconis TaxID=2654983 RepID=UPI002AB05196|nr:response regulator [Paraburkholderia franconis]
MTAPPTVTPVRILLVDDNARTPRRRSARCWNWRGHEVKRAQCGPDALAIVESFTPDVAFIDISIPGMDGLELAQLLRLRAQCCQTKPVALTGYTSSVSGIQSDERIFDRHLIKPLSLDDLADVLRYL